MIQQFPKAPSGPVGHGTGPLEPVQPGGAGGNHNELERLHLELQLQNERELASINADLREMIDEEKARQKSETTKNKGDGDDPLDESHKAAIAQEVKRAAAAAYADGLREGRRVAALAPGAQRPRGFYEPRPSSIDDPLAEDGYGR